MENVKKFYDAMTNDEALRNRAMAFNDKYEGKQPDEDTTIADLITFAKAEGYEFTADEYRAFAAKSRELADNELEAVAGGAFTESNCYCSKIGAGHDPESGSTCACVIGGGGKKDKRGNYLFCVILGGPMFG